MAGGSADAGAIKGRMEAEDKVSASVDAVTKKLGQFQKSVVGIFAAMKINDFLKAQGEAEAAVNKLNQTLVNQGNYTAQASKDLREYAAGLQDVTQFSQGAVMAAENILATFGQTPAMIQETTSAAADLAAGLGIDLESAATALGKAYAGNTTSLQKMGVQVDQSKKGTEQFASALDSVNSKFGGQAALAVTTYAGQVAQVTNAYSDVEEAIGKFLGQLLDVGGGANLAVMALKGISSFFSDTLVRALGEARALFGETFAFFFESIARITGDLGKLSAMGGFKEDAKFWGDVAKGAEDYAVGLQKAADGFRVTSAAAAEGAGNIQKVGDTTEGLAKKQELLAKASKIAGHEIKDVGEATKIVADANEKAAKSAEEHAAAMAKLRAALTDVGRAAVEAKTLKDLNETIKSVGGVAKLSEDELKRFQAAMSEAGKKGVQDAKDLGKAWYDAGGLIQLAAMNLDLTGLAPDVASQGTGDAAADHAAAVQAAADAMEKQINDAKELEQIQGDAAAQLLAQNKIIGSEYDDILGKATKVTDETKKNAEAGARWNSLLQGAAMLAGAIGGEFGDMLNVVANISKSFEDWGKKLPTEKFAAIASAVGQIGGLMGGMAGAGVQGAAGGAMMGDSISKMLGATGPVGAIIGGAIGLIGGIFGNAKKKAEEAKKKAEELARKQDEAMKAFGDMFDSWKDARRDLAAVGAQGINSIFEALGSKGGEGLTSAANAASYLAASFATLRASGMSVAESLAQLKPSFDQMRKNPEMFKGTEASPLLAMAKFAEANAALFQFTSGLGMTAQALAGFGMLTQDMATKMSLDMGGAIDQMVEKGLSYQQALALSSQDLYNLKMAAEAGGVALDEHTQKMVDDAEAAGLFKNLEDPMKKLVEINGAMVAAMGTMVQLLGGKVPAAVQKMIDEFNNAQVNVNVDVNVNGGSAGQPTPGERVPDGKAGGAGYSYAGGSGGLVDFGRGASATLHGKEAVLTESQWGGLTAAAARGMGGGGNAEMTNLIRRLPSELGRAVRDALARTV